MNSRVRKRGGPDSYLLCGREIMPNSRYHAATGAVQHSSSIDNRNTQQTNVQEKQAKRPKHSYDDDNDTSQKTSSVEAAAACG